MDLRISVIQQRKVFMPSHIFLFCGYTLRLKSILCDQQVVLQEATCLRIVLLFSNSVVLESAVKLPDISLHAFYLTLKEFDLTIPVNGALMNEIDRGGPFTGIRIHVSGFMIAYSPFLSFRMLDLDNDPACSSVWKDQPVQSNHQRYRDFNKFCK